MELTARQMQGIQARRMWMAIAARGPNMHMDSFKMYIKEDLPTECPNPFSFIFLSFCSSLWLSPSASPHLYERPGLVSFSSLIHQALNALPSFASPAPP